MIILRQCPINKTEDEDNKRAIKTHKSDFYMALGTSLDMISF